MSQEFIPFLPKIKPPPGSSESQAQPTEPKAEAPSFAPVTFAAAAQPCTPTPPEAVAPPAPVAKAPASVTVKREGDRVTQIYVHCSCGERIELDCSY